MSNHNHQEAHTEAECQVNDFDVDPDGLHDCGHDVKSGPAVETLKNPRPKPPSDATTGPAFKPGRDASTGPGVK